MRRLALLAATIVSCASSSSPQSDGPAFGEVLHGDGTFYAATGDGACMFGPSPDDLDVAAMNAPQWGNSDVCGACAAVTGPKGTVHVRIVDLCPECQAGDLDLSAQAFAQIAEPVQGRVGISWQLEACGVTGNLDYHLKDGSSQWWTAIQVRNHRLPVRSLAWLDKGTWVDLERQSYNYFVAATGTGPGAIHVRVTAWDGQALEDDLPGPVPDATYEGAGQFE
jgi:expansin (peptidoglycan-binding protein)